MRCAAAWRSSSRKNQRVFAQLLCLARSCLQATPLHALCPIRCRFYHILHGPAAHTWAGLLLRSELRSGQVSEQQHCGAHATHTCIMYRMSTSDNGERGYLSSTAKLNWCSTGFPLTLAVSSGKMSAFPRHYALVWCSLHSKSFILEVRHSGSPIGTLPDAA